MKKDLLLEINNLNINIASKSGHIYPISDLDLKIKRSETMALIGESGCGKSMTASSIMQLLPHNSYCTQNSIINFEQVDLLSKTEIQMRRIRGNDIAMIFQDPMTALNPVYTVGNQLIEIIKIKAKKNISKTDSKQSHKDQALFILKEVGLPDPIRQYNSYPHQLSGGMRQRVVIAMALAAKPKLLIADEPTTALDVTIQLQILSLLKKLQAKYGMSLLLITHDLGLVAQIADSVSVMYAGYIVESADKHTIINSPRHPYTKMLLKAQPSYDNRNNELAVIKGFVPRLDKKFKLCRFKDRCPVAGAKCYTENPKLEYYIESTSGNHQVRCYYQDKTIPSLDNTIVNIDTNKTKNNKLTSLLEVNNLKVYFPIYKGILKRVSSYIKAVDDISFDINPGQTMALVGESGSGKTTVAKALIGLLSKEGEVNYRSDLMQIIFQDPYSALNPRMMIIEIIQEGYYSIYKKRMSQSEIVSLLETVGLNKDVIYRYPHEFSGGQRQRIAIARSLAVRSRLLILDEPTSALDLSVQAQILNLLKRLQKEYNLSYLFITHDLSVVSFMADYVAVMYLGKIIEYGDTNSVVNSPKHPYTQSLLESVPSIDNPVDLNKNIIQGEIASLTSLPSGCYFRTRCPHAMNVCSGIFPSISKLSTNHIVNCYLYDKNN